MRAVINFKDGKVAIVNNLKFVNKINTTSSTVTKIENFDDFMIYHQGYVFVGDNSKASVHGEDVLYVTFES